MRTLQPDIKFRGRRELDGLARRQVDLLAQKSGRICQALVFLLEQERAVCNNADALYRA